jgi:photosystem II stability/assembly factor-like uncharacterized protein
MTPPIRIPSRSFRHVWGGVVQRVFVRSPTEAWTAEECGRIRHTNDGGVTWSVQPTPESIDAPIRGIYFLAASPIGWAVGTSGRILKTSDGGATWNVHGPELRYPVGDPLAGIPMDLWDVFFLDELHGWLCGIHALLMTTDGGQSWTDLFTLNPGLKRDEELYRLAFLVQGGNFVGLAVSEPGLILRTVDGTDWTIASEVEPFCPGLADPIEMWDMQFLPGASPTSGVGYAVGGQGNQCGGLLTSIDGGQTWTQEDTAALPPTVYGVAPLQLGIAVACGYGGRAYRRDPAADPPWTNISHLLAPPAPDVNVPMWGAGGDGHSTAWLVGLMNHVFRTDDAGASWVQQRGAGAWRMRNLHFFDRDHGWAVAQQTTILETSTAGVTWREKHFELAGPTLNAIAFRTNLLGIAVGNQGAALRPRILYRDASVMPPVFVDADPLPPTIPLNSALLSAVWTTPLNNDAWAVGTKSLVVRSTDGIGKVWTHFTAPPSLVGVELEGLAFDGVNALYIAGNHRALKQARAYRIRYPALAWEDLSPPALGGDWTAICALGNEIYAVGSDAIGVGVIYKFDPLSGPPTPQWTQVYPRPNDPPPQMFHSVAAIGAGATFELFAGGDRGMVVHFANGQWSTLRSQTNVTLTGLTLLSNALGYAVGHGSIDGQGLGSPSVLGDSSLVRYE